MPGRVVITDAVDPRVTLNVLTAVKHGDFSARMPANWTGTAGRVAAALNEIIESNQRLERELHRLSKRVGKEGQMKRAPLGDAGGAWASTLDAVNDLIEDLARPDVPATLRAKVQAFVDLYKAQHELRRYRDQLQALVQERTAALTEINRELEGFSYLVSHDLKAPLLAMDTLTRSLADADAEQLAEGTRAQLVRLRQASQQLATLFDGMQTLFQLTGGDIWRQPVDVTKVALDAIEELRSAEPNREVGVDVAEGLGVDGDAKLVRILVGNLISNAWKFTRNEPRARIRVGSESLGDETRIFVRDNGVGFDMIYAHKLFGAFQRLHSQNEFTGQGIGLATAQRIVNRHGGRIWAEGAVGEGAAFFFVI